MFSALGYNQMRNQVGRCKHNVATAIPFNIILIPLNYSQTTLKPIANAVHLLTKPCTILMYILDYSKVSKHLQLDHQWPNKRNC